MVCSYYDGTKRHGKGVSVYKVGETVFILRRDIALLQGREELDWKGEITSIDESLIRVGT